MSATAIVGTGFIGPVHLEALRRLGRPVAGVLGSSPDKSAASGAGSRRARGYANFDEVLADPDVSVDPPRLAESAALRALPARHRRRQARALREAARHEHA